MTMNDFLRYVDECDCSSLPRMALELFC